VLVKRENAIMLSAACWVESPILAADNGDHTIGASDLPRTRNRMAPQFATLIMRGHGQWLYVTKGVGSVNREPQYIGNDRTQRESGVMEPRTEHQVRQQA
jgi:hypothetical protein